MTKTVQKTNKNAILLMHCPDQSGIVAVVTDFININGGNILYLDQYVDRENRIFFMRIEWDLTHFIIPEDKIEEYFHSLCAQKYCINFSLYFSDRIPRMAIFVSTMSHCLYDLLARYTAGEWEVEIPLIISNHPDMEIAAKRFGIDYKYFPITKENKAEQEAAELALLKEEFNEDFLKQLNSYHVDLVVLAGFLVVIPEQMIAKYRNRIINIHHSFLPAFIGAKPYHAAFERGVKLIGATSHYVTSDLDAGPIIEQDITRISHKDPVASLIRKGRDLEKIVLSRAVEKHIERKILVYQNKTVVF